MDEEFVRQKHQELSDRYGPWWDNFRLKGDVWTIAPSSKPNPRLLRLIQIVEALSTKPVSAQRILDLACAGGHCALEFALRKAEVVGVEGRESSIKKAEFARDVYGAENLKFVHDDVRNVSAERYGIFDVVLCCGILYHLPAEDIGPFVERLYDLSTHLVIVDTHVALAAHSHFQHRGREYHGALTLEHSPRDSAAIKEGRQRASLGNELSFSLTRPSLVNLLSSVGFTSVFECLFPVVAGLPDRCTLVAVKAPSATLKTFPDITPAAQLWSEGDLTYAKRSRLLAEGSWRAKQFLTELGLYSSLRRLVRRRV